MTKISSKVDELAAGIIRLQADRNGVTVPELLRPKPHLVPVPPVKPGTVRCPHTGAPVFSAPDTRPPFTTEALRELLADFP